MKRLLSLAVVACATAAYPHEGLKKAIQQSDKLAVKYYLVIKKNQLEPEMRKELQELAQKISDKRSSLLAFATSYKDWWNTAKGLAMLYPAKKSFDFSKRKLLPLIAKGAIEHFYDALDLNLGIWSLLVAAPLSIVGTINLVKGVTFWQARDKRVQAKEIIQLLKEPESVKNS